MVGAHDPDGSKDRALLNGRYPLLPVPVQRHESQTGHRAGRAYPPEPPESEGDEPPPAGTALAPPAGVAGWSPLSERDLGCVTEVGTNVKDVVAISETISKQAHKRLLYATRFSRSISSANSNRN